MADYSADHAGALADVNAAGNAVTFTRDVAGTYDPETGVETGATQSTVTGSAIQVRGNPDTYRELSLIESKAPTLFFTPDTFGEFPKPGDAVTWGSEVFEVRDVNHIRPDGNTIACRVVISG